jgi:hypothetical protein
MSTITKESEASKAYKAKQAADAKKLINPKAKELGEAIKKQLSDRVKKLEKQPSAIANGGLDAIIKSVCETISDKTPNVKAVAIVTVLGKCGSRATKADKEIK